MGRNRPRELALAGAALLLIAAVVWGVQHRTAQPPVTPVPATSMSNGAQAQPTHPIAEVDLEALGVDHPEPGDSVRNPFRFQPRTAPPPSAAAITQQQQQAAAAAQAASGPAEPQPQPRIPLKYIGEMADPTKPGRRVAILSDARGVYYGREGEVVEGRYRIVRIGVESIELTYLDGRGRQTIRQTGQ